MDKMDDVMQIFVTSVQDSRSQCILKAQVNFEAYSEVEELLKDFGNDNGAKVCVSIQSLHEGDVFVAKYHLDNAWYRAQLLKKNADNVSVQVAFIDFGNEENVALADIIKAPGNYFIIPPLAVPFIVAGIGPGDYNVWSKEEIDHLKETLVNNEFTAKVVQDGMPGRPSTIELICEGNDVVEDLLTAKIGKAAPKITLPTIPRVAFEKGKSYPVYVTYTESPLNFWIQDISAEEKIESMHALIETKANTIPTEFDITPGMLCLAKYTETGTFYRGVICEVNADQSVKVLYIDYGNTDTVDIIDIKVPLPEEFCVLPVQAVPCCLKGDEVGKSNFNVIVDSDDLQVTVGSMTDAGNLIVEIRTEPVSSSVIHPTQATSSENIGKQSNQTVTAQDSHQMLHFTQMQFDVGVRHNSCISDVNETNGEFYCQLMKNGPILDELMDKLQQCELLPVQRKLSKGSPCLVRSNTDNLVYRATVEHTSEQNSYVACMIDFGFTEIVNLKSMFEITGDLIQVPRQCFKCKLDKAEKVPPQRLVSMLQSYNSKVPIVLEVLLKAGDSYLVELFDTVKTNLALSKYLTEVHANRHSISPPKSLPEKTTPKPCTQIIAMAKVPEANVQLGSSETIFVTSILDDSNFFGQLTKYPSEALDGLQTKLSEQYSKKSETLQQPGIGDLCCTVFSEDGQFYRAQVITINGAQILVSFIDFGNQEIKAPSDLYRLMPEFCSLPRQGVMCLVDGYEGSSVGVLERCLLDKEINIHFAKQVKQCYSVIFPDSPCNTDINSSLTR